MTQQEQNKQIVGQYVNAVNRGDFNNVETLFAPDAEIQGALTKGHMDKVIPIWRELHEGLQMRLTIQEMIAEEDTVAVRYTERGTFRRSFFGQAPTGNSYEIVAMEWFIIRDGKIQQRWGARDHASRARQIGMSLE